MTLDFNCESCDTSFEMEMTELLDEDKIQCPSCDVKAPKDLVLGVTSALEELFGGLGRLNKKFTVTFAIESDDLPPPYDQGGAPEEDADDEEEPERGGDEDDDEEDPLEDEDDDEEGVEY